VFLDEIGDMRFDMQVKLLRILEDGLVSRVGGGAPLPVDVRVISATNQDIDKAIEDGRFREDLYFRLGVIILKVPDLASRAEDIPLLIEHFQRAKPRAVAVRFDASGMARMLAHRWPGNVRELRNVVERAGVLSGGKMLNAHDVSQLLNRTGSRLVSGSELQRRSEAGSEETAVSVAALVQADYTAPSAMPINLKEILETMELERIQMALDMADGVISEAARMLTLKRTTLIEKMRKYGVDQSC
jgi:sigma-54 dependent transcriptional regulator, flagellar regulatory protein